MSIATKFKSLNGPQLAAIAFFTATGIMLLAFLPLSGFPPHLGFLGILSFITAYSLFTKRPWTQWLLFILLVTITVFSLYTLYAVGFSNILVTLSMLGYAILTWIIIILIRKR